jgi:hypothetical protein
MREQGVSSWYFFKKVTEVYRCHRAKSSNSDTSWLVSVKKVIAYSYLSIAPSIWIRLTGKENAYIADRRAWGKKRCLISVTIVGSMESNT